MTPYLRRARRVARYYTDCAASAREAGRHGSAEVFDGRARQARADAIAHAVVLTFGAALPVVALYLAAVL